uniref:low affinity vacuolar monovalent cation/H(+) antiporter-like n=1 Tax=Oncorhynchus gorbuscha TaxID=8017 RepID=UPI001EAF486C
TQWDHDPRVYRTYIPIPNGTMTPGSTAIPNGTMTPGSTAIPNGTMTPGSTAIPNGTMTPGSTAIPNGTMTPGSTAIPNGTMTPGSTAIPNGTMTPGSTAVHPSVTDCVWTLAVMWARPSPDVSHQYTPKCLSAHKGCTTPCHHGEEVWQDGSSLRTTIRAENEVEANKLANNYRFGFRKWKSHVTERPIEDRSDIVRELYSELNFVRPQGSLITCGNIAYLILFGWWISLAYLLVCVLMFLTIIGVPYGKLCWKLSCYFLWPFGKSILKPRSLVRRCCVKFPHCEAIPEESDSKEVKESTPLLMPPSVPIEVPPQRTRYWCRVSTYVWLLLGYPLLGLIHSLACFLSWILVFTIPVAKMNARTLAIILLMPPEDVHIHRLKKQQGCDSQVLLCCYHAFNWYYYKYTLDGINVFAVNLLPLVITTLVVGYVDTENQFVSSEAKFGAAVSSIIPLSYYIGMGIASISAQSNFAVGAVVNATFGSITEMTFYITALLRGHKAGTKCYEEIVKAALTGTLLGCILFIPGISMIIGGFKHREQRFNSRSAGVSSALLFISVG